MSIVRYNLMTIKGYTPYCGSELCKPRTSYPFKGSRWLRTKFNGSQFKCPKCGWESSFEQEFINKYKTKQK